MAAANPSASSPAAPMTVEFRAHWWNWAFFASCFAATAGWFASLAMGLIPSDHVHVLADRIFIGFGAFATALFARWLAWHAIARRGVVVRLTPDGLTDHRLAECEIPWREVTGCSLVNDRNLVAVRVWLTPTFAQDRFEASVRPLYKLRLFLGETGALVGVRGLRDTNLRRVGATVAVFVKAYGSPEPVPAATTASSASPIPPVTAVTSNIPVVTLTLCIVLVIGYMGEVGAIGFKPNADALLSFGAVARSNVMEGQWWRLVTAPLLHLSPAHLILNVIALWIVGRALEPLAGLGLYLAGYVASALAGSFASAALSSMNVVSVGASGGIMGLVGMAAVIAFGSQRSEKRSRLLSASMPIMVPTLLASFGTAGASVDLMAHLGGLLTGAAVGGMFLAAGESFGTGGDLIDQHGAEAATQRGTNAGDP